MKSINILPLFLVIAPPNFTSQNAIFNLNECLTHIVGEYFFGQAVRVYKAGELCFTEWNESVCFDFPSAPWSEATFELATKRLVFSARSRNVFVFVSDEDLDIFDRIFSVMKETSQWDTKVLVVAFCRNEPIHAVENIFGEIWRRTRLINTIVMTVNVSEKENGEEFSFYSWYPYQRGSCERVENVMLVDHWKNGHFETGRDLFVNSGLSRGLNGCQIRVTTAITDFFTIFEDIPDDNSEGMDFMITRAVAEKYEIRYKYVFPPPEENHWHRTYPNGSLQGSMRMLHNYESDVVFSGLRIIPRTLPYLTLSHVYFLDYVRWIVPRTLVKDEWKLVNNFSPQLWVAVVVSLLICSAFVYLLSKAATCWNHQDFSFFHCLLEMFALTLGHPATGLSGSLALKLVLLSYAVYSMNIAASYESQLVGILTAPLSRSPYDSLEAAFSGGLDMYLLPYDEMYYKNDRLGEKILNSSQYKVIKRYKATIGEIVYNKTAAMLIGYSRIRHLLSTSLHDARGEPLVDFIPGRVSTNLIVFHFSPNNALKGIFDVVILRLIQAGIINKWKFDLWRPKGIGVDLDQGNQSLSMHHLENIFHLYGIFVLVSTVAFLCEIAYFHLVRRRKIQPQQV